MGEIKAASDTNRIVCIDPNNIYGSVDGQPVTPDYTDYSVWCNLVVETVPRVKNQAGGTDGTGTYAIQYDMTSDSKNNFVSFFQGYDAEKYNYLTTDYTEIDFSTVKKRSIIEGLQVNSVNVSFINYMCPTVTIKFTDIRGGGFFAREEATHDEYGRLQRLETRDGNVTDNVFGCFMTFPYPRFKLQIKGFYGNAVTYHLTCSRFSGSLNQATGNFELTATFIGYEYGVLGEIPFPYILAAPYTVTGSKYWDSRVTSDDWRLSYTLRTEDGADIQVDEAPTKLIDFYNNIEGAISEMNDSEDDLSELVSDASAKDVLESYARHIQSLKDIQAKEAELKREITRIVGAENTIDVVGADTDVLVVFASKGDGVSFTSDVVRLRNELCDMVLGHMDKYEGDDAVDAYMQPNCNGNGETEYWDRTSTLVFGKYMHYCNGNPSNPSAVDKECSENGVDVQIDRPEACVNSRIVKLGSSDRYSVSAAVSQALFESLGNCTDTPKYGSGRKEWSRSPNRYRPYAAVIDFGNSSQKIAESLTNIRLKERKFREREKTYKPIGEMLGFSPYIGSYFKVVMCHLETFVHLIYGCADEIYKRKERNERAPSKMGIVNLEYESDIPSRSFNWVPPFPAVYKRHQTKEEVDRLLLNGDNIQETSWVGDFKGDTPWDEEALVRELAEALTLTWDKIESEGKVRRVSQRIAGGINASYNPLDCILDFPLYAFNDKPTMAYYTAIRAMLLFGVMDTSWDDSADGEGNIREYLGALDAYNYVAKCDNNEEIKSLMGDGSGEKLRDEIIGIVTCTSNNGTTGDTYPFEFAATGGPRQPALKKDGDMFSYVYMTAKGDGTPIVPLKNAKSLAEKDRRMSDDYEWSGQDGFKVKAEAVSDYVFGASGAGFSEGMGFEEYALENRCMFSVNRDPEFIDSCLKSSEVLRKAKSIGNYESEKVSGAESRYTLGSENLEGYRSAKKVKVWCSDGYSEAGITEDMFCSEDGTDGDGIPRTVSDSAAFTASFSEKAPLGSVSCVYTSVGQGWEKSRTNLFTSRFYYMQNILPENPTAEDTARSLYSKALLYLHTLPFDYTALMDGTVKSFFNRVGSDAERHGGKEIVPYGLLPFLGGLIWRKRWRQENGYDPIRFEGGGCSMFKPSNGFDPLLVRLGDSDVKTVFAVTAASDASSNPYDSEGLRVRYDDIVCSEMDTYVQNTLVSEFVKFANSDFRKSVMAACELYVTTDRSSPQPTPEPEQPDGVTYDADQGASGMEMSLIGPGDIADIENCLKTKGVSEALEILKGAKPFDEGVSDEPVRRYVSGFTGGYAMGFYDTATKSVQAYFQEKNPAREVFASLFGETAMAMTVGHNVNGESVSGKFNSQYYRDYLDGFVSVLECYTTAQMEKEKSLAENKSEPEKPVSEREMLLSVYMEIKNIWDRWLCSYYNADISQDRDPSSIKLGRDFFDVRKRGRNNRWQDTIFSNFVFIDSFYEDISHQLKLNCDVLASEYDDTKKNLAKGKWCRTITHLGNIAGHHRCIMLMYPDYIGFDTNTMDEVKNRMEDLFRPVPSSKVPPPTPMNKCVIVYANFANTMTDQLTDSGFRSDSFNIYSLKDGTAIAPNLFNSTSRPGRNPQRSRMGYTVPSFCVEYSRQTNSYWLNMGVSMDNFAVTETAIMAYAAIAEKGNSSSRQVCFYGQDLYPIHQAYAYSVTIEMMGDAQIQPLMYFQVLNVPMFNGAYMVTRVSHEMKPGFMKTVITGTKISRVRVPYTKGWFATPKSGQAAGDRLEADYSNDGNDVMTSLTGDIIDIADDKLSAAINSQMSAGKSVNCDVFVKNVYGELGVDIKHTLLGEKPNNMFTELSNSEDWEDMHAFPDVQTKSNKWRGLFSGKEHPQCGDLLFTYHGGDITSTPGDQFHHVAIFLGFAGERSSDMFVAEGVSVAGQPVNEKDARVHVCRIQESRIGLGTDLTTHWIRCKKYQVQQKQAGKEDDDIRITDRWTVVNDNIGTYSGTVYYTIQDFLKKGSELEDYHERDKDTKKNKENGTTYTVEQIKGNIQALIDNVLNPMADIVVATSNKPSITSGYRNRQANDSAGGAVNSQHMQGMAADLQYTSVAYVENFGIASVILNFNLPFDQLIIYPPSGTNIDTNRGVGSAINDLTDFTNFYVNNCSFIHVSHNRNARQQRGMVGIVTYRGKGKNDPSHTHWLTNAQLQQLKG